MTRFASDAGASPLVELSDAVVEAGLYDAPDGTALVLANFTYKPIAKLQVTMPSIHPISSVISRSHGDLPFEGIPISGSWKEEGYRYTYRFSLSLESDDIVLFHL